MAVDEAAWDTPLIGFANGADPIFDQYKEVVGPFHWTPLEVYRMAFPDETIQAENLTVISWILPQTEATKQDNRKQTTYPAERWARSRIFGENFNQALRTQCQQDVKFCRIFCRCSCRFGIMVS